MFKKHRLPRKKKHKEMLGAKIIRRKGYKSRAFLESSRLSHALVVALQEGKFPEYKGSMSPESLYELLSKQKALTHRRQKAVHPKSTGHVVLFAEDLEGNDNYGHHVWVLKTKLPKPGKDIVNFAAEFYGVSKSDAEDLVNPDDIVDSGGAWDDPDFVSELWQAMEGGEVKEQVGFRTYDGAVVIDPYSIKMDYYYEDKDMDDDE